MDAIKHFLYRAGQKLVVHMGQKNVWGHEHFFRRGYLRPKFNFTFFYHKFDAKYFHVKQFFRKNQYFLEKLQKTVL